MQTYNIFTNTEDSLPSGKADFLLITGATKHCEDEKELLYSQLDSQLLKTQELLSSLQTNEEFTHSPSPVIITRALENLNGFSAIERLNFNAQESFDAKDIFGQGMDFGKSYELKGNYLILGESIACSETTVKETILALGYESQDNEERNSFEKLTEVSDASLVFCAGFLLEATRRFHVVLAGGTLMATILLIADALREDVLMRIKHDNITLATLNNNSELQQILTKLSYTPHALYTEFDFKDSEIEALRCFNSKNLLDRCGAGAALAYATTNSLTQAEVLNEVEIIIYCL